MHTCLYDELIILKISAKWSLAWQNEFALHSCAALPRVSLSSVSTYALYELMVCICITYLCHFFSMLSKTDLTCGSNLGHVSSALNFYMWCEVLNRANWGYQTHWTGWESPCSLFDLNCHSDWYCLEVQNDLRTVVSAWILSCCSVLIYL